MDIRDILDILDIGDIHNIQNIYDIQRHGEVYIRRALYPSR
jgi:hypothetical protein